MEFSTKFFLIFVLINFNTQLTFSNDVLIEAIGDRDRDIVEVQALLDDGVDPNSSDDYGNTALQIAASICYVEAMEALLNAHVDPNATSHRGNTPLQIASKNGCIEGVRLLLSFNADPYHKTNIGITALMSASLNNHPEMVRLLLQIGADPNAANHHGRTALTMAVLNRRLEIAADLLAWGGDPNYINSNGDIAVFISAVHNCDAEMMQLLLDYGTDPYSINKEDKEAALLIVIQRGCVASTKLLLSMGGIDVNRIEDNRTSLIISVESRLKALQHLAEVEMKRKNLLNGREDAFYDEVTQIYPEVHLEVMDLLLKAGASPDVTDQDDFTPLMSVAIENDIEAAKVLLNHGADTGYTNYLGYSALNIASLNGDGGMIELIRGSDEVQK